MATALHFIINIDYLEVLTCPCKHFFALAVAMQVLQLRIETMEIDNLVTEWDTATSTLTILHSHFMCSRHFFVFIC